MARASRFEILPVLQALARQHRMAEGHQRPHQISSRRSRAGRPARTRRASMPSRRISSTTLRMTLLVGADGVPVVLDRDQHDVVDALVGQQIFLVIGEDFEDQPLDALRPPEPRERATAQAVSSSSPRQRWQIASTMAFLEGRSGRHWPATFSSAGDVGHRGLGEAQPAEQRLGGLHDPRRGYRRAWF